MNLRWRDVMLILILEAFAILFALTFMFVGIWGFILIHRIFNQLRYKNYLLEKMVENIASLQSKDIPSLKYINKKPEIVSMK